jgi:hypothetical protein
MLWICEACDLKYRAHCRSATEFGPYLDRPWWLVFHQLVAYWAWTTTTDPCNTHGPPARTNCLSILEGMKNSSRRSQNHTPAERLCLAIHPNNHLTCICSSMNPTIRIHLCASEDKTRELSARPGMLTILLPTRSLAFG